MSIVGPGSVPTAASNAKEADLELMDTSKIQVLNDRRDVVICEDSHDNEEHMIDSELQVDASCSIIDDVCAYI